MDEVSRTLYIPLYGKAHVSRNGIILSDPTAETLWDRAQIRLTGKSRSRWLAYYLAMRAVVYDAWLREQIRQNPDAVVLHIGCGLDSRIRRLGHPPIQWHDIDFPDVIRERRHWFRETETYTMTGTDMRIGEWKALIPGGQPAIVVMEGVSMYFKPEEFVCLLTDLGTHFSEVRLLMDCYSTRAARLSRMGNPIRATGVNQVWGMDDPETLAVKTGLVFVQEHDMTPECCIRQLSFAEQMIFRQLYAGRLARGLYRLYEFRSSQEPGQAVSPLAAPERDRDH